MRRSRRDTPVRAGGRLRGKRGYDGDGGAQGGGDLAERRSLEERGVAGMGWFGLDVGVPAGGDADFVEAIIVDAEVVGDLV